MQDNYYTGFRYTMARLNSKCLREGEQDLITVDIHPDTLIYLSKTLPNNFLSRSTSVIDQLKAEMRVVSDFSDFRVNEIIIRDIINEYGLEGEFTIGEMRKIAYNKINDGYVKEVLIAIDNSRKLSLLPKNLNMQCNIDHSPYARIKNSVWRLIRNDCRLINVTQGFVVDYKKRVPSKDVFLQMMKEGKYLDNILKPGISINKNLREIVLSFQRGEFFSKVIISGQNEERPLIRVPLKVFFKKTENLEEIECPLDLIKPNLNTDKVRARDILSFKSIPYLWIFRQYTFLQPYDEIIKGFTPTVTFYLPYSMDLIWPLTARLFEGRQEESLIVLEGVKLVSCFDKGL